MTGYDQYKHDLQYAKWIPAEVPKDKKDWRGCHVRILDSGKIYRITTATVNGSIKLLSPILGGGVIFGKKKEILSQVEFVRREDQN